MTRVRDVNAVDCTFAPVTFAKSLSPASQPCMLSLRKNAILFRVLSELIHLFVFLFVCAKFLDDAMIFIFLSAKVAKRRKCWAIFCNILFSYVPSKGHYIEYAMP